MSKSFMKHSKITQRVSYIKLYWDFVEDFSGVYGTNDEKFYEVKLHHLSNFQVLYLLISKYYMSKYYISNYYIY